MAALAAGKERAETCFQLLPSPFLFSMKILFKSGQGDVRALSHILVWFIHCNGLAKAFLECRVAGTWAKGCLALQLESL